MTLPQVEQEIQKALAEETSAVTLSQKLFSPTGLFSLLAATEAERRVLVQTPLFKQAQQRFRELQFKEAEEFRKVVSQLQETDLAKHYALKIEGTRTA